MNQRRIFYRIRKSIPWTSLDGRTKQATTDPIPGRRSSMSGIGNKKQGKEIQIDDRPVKIIFPFFSIRLASLNQFCDEAIARATCRNNCSGVSIGCPFFIFFQIALFPERVKHSPLI